MEEWGGVGMEEWVGWGWRSGWGGDGVHSEKAGA